VECLHGLPEEQCTICQDSRKPRTKRRSGNANNAQQRWTDDDEYQLALLRRGEATEIAARLGRTEAAINAHSLRMLARYARSGECHEGNIRRDTEACVKCGAKHRWVTDLGWLPIGSS